MRLEGSATIFAFDEIKIKSKSKINHVFIAGIFYLFSYRDIDG